MTRRGKASYTLSSLQTPRAGTPLRRTRRPMPQRANRHNPYPRDSLAAVLSGHKKGLMPVSSTFRSGPQAFPPKPRRFALLVFAIRVMNVLRCNPPPPDFRLRVSGLEAEGIES